MSPNPVPPATVLILEEIYSFVEEISTLNIS